MKVDIDIDEETLVPAALRELYEDIERLKHAWSNTWEEDLKAVKKVHNFYVYPEDKI